tara:strand:+ start:790 stop:1134 length:345 start_codon:yes stop_codon:yes gene_type:complete
MSQEKKLEILREIHTDVWDEETGHPEFLKELRMGVALLIEYYGGEHGYTPRNMEVKRMRQLRQEIEQTQNEERKHLRDMDEKGWVTSDRDITEGWIEALKYVLGRMDVLGGEEE